jgi:hypothetical protein
MTTAEILKGWLRHKTVRNSMFAVIPKVNNSVALEWPCAGAGNLKIAALTIRHRLNDSIRLGKSLLASGLITEK